MKKQIKNIAEKTLKGDLYNKAVLPKHYGLALAANVKRGFPAKDLKVIGITGTNGKTSTCFIVQKMLTEAGYKTGMMTTVAYGLDGKLEDQVAHMTSQSINLTLDRIKKMQAQGMEWLVLEVTSHALAQFRTMGIPIDIAVMTNITHEHLDYHGTFENYRNAKLRLFKAADRNMNGRRLGIINADDDSAALFADAVTNVAAYSLEDNPGTGVAHPKKLKITPRGSTYELQAGKDTYKITCNVPGSFNVSNSMAAALVGRAIGLTAKQIEKGIAALHSIEGRMTKIDEGQDFDVIVDFAHTPDSFKKLFGDIRPVVKGQLISVFGSAGRRDVSKRGEQGKIAGKYSDVVIVTEEDDRDVDGQLIMDQIATGAEKSGKVKGESVLQIHDRETAIKEALSMAKKGDTVMLLGKGHEKTIERADGEHPWDEIGLTKKILKELKKPKK